MCVCSGEARIRVKKQPKWHLKFLPLFLVHKDQTYAPLPTIGTILPAWLVLNKVRQARRKQCSYPRRPLLLLSDRLHLLLGHLSASSKQAHPFFSSPTAVIVCSQLRHLRRGCIVAMVPILFFCSLSELEENLSMGWSGWMGAATSQSEKECPKFWGEKKKQTKNSCSWRYQGIDLRSSPC